MGVYPQSCSYLKTANYASMKYCNLLDQIMLANFQIDELSKKLLEILPFNRQEIEEDVRQKIKIILQSSLVKLDVVSREEFDVQTQVLAKTRQKVEFLEKQIQELIEKQKK
jgi:ubiquinone biosynthesis accessory factor UbiK